MYTLKWRTEPKGSTISTVSGSKTKLPHKKRKKTIGKLGATTKTLRRTKGTKEWEPSNFLTITIVIAGSIFFGANSPPNKYLYPTTNYTFFFLLGFIRQPLTPVEQIA